MTLSRDSSSELGKRVAVVGTRGFPGVQGGIETHCENLYPLLAERGYEVTVFTRKPYVDPAPRDYRGVRLIPLSCPRSKFLETIVHTFFAVLAARRLAVDLVHFHAVGPALFVPLARLLGMRTIVRHVGQDYRRKKWGPLARAVLRLGEYCSTKADHVICITSVIADELRAGYRSCKLCVIPNGVPPPLFVESRKLLDQYELEPGKYILFAGRLVPEKGLDVLVDAFERLDRDLGWKLVVCGGDEHQSSYSRNLNLKIRHVDGIVATGELPRSELAELYSHAGVFCLPSFHEGLSFSLLEALSYGLPCVASDIPANMTVPLSDAQYFRAGDPDDLARRLASQIQLDRPSAERKRLGRKIVAEYDWEVIADRTQDLYEAILSHSGG